jgi:hypothetical protein
MEEFGAAVDPKISSRGEKAFHSSKFDNCTSSQACSEAVHFLTEAKYILTMMYWE